MKNTFDLHLTHTIHVHIEVNNSVRVKQCFRILWNWSLQFDLSASSFLFVSLFTYLADTHILPESALHKLLSFPSNHSLVDDKTMQSGLCMCVRESVCVVKIGWSCAFIKNKSVSELDWLLQIKDTQKHSRDFTFWGFEICKQWIAELQVRTGGSFNNTKTPLTECESLCCCLYHNSSQASPSPPDNPPSLSLPFALWIIISFLWRVCVLSPYLRCWGCSLWTT